MARRALLALVVALIASDSGQASTAITRETAPASPPAGPTGDIKDFAFLLGEWTVHHRVRRAGTADEWTEFEGTCRNRTLIGGQANVEEHTFNRPPGVTHGIAIRAFDPRTHLWAIWWIDARDPHGALDPPVKGRFINGIGTFYSDQLIDGKPTRTRFIWSQITGTSARWEQAYSLDAGKTWQTNWIMEFKRA